MQKEKCIFELNLGGTKTEADEILSKVIVFLFDRENCAKIVL